MPMRQSMFAFPPATAARWIAAGAAGASVWALAAGSAAAADMTCAAVAEGGLACFGAAGVKVYSSKNSPTPARRIHNLAGCGDHFAVLGSRVLVTFDGAAWGKPIRTPHFTYALSCRGKVYWVGGAGKVSRYADGKWQTWDRKDIFPDVRRPDIRAVVASDKGAWALTNRSAIAYFDGAKWTVYAQGKGFDRPYRFERGLVDTKGRPWIAGGVGLFAFEGGKWKLVVRPGATRFVSEGPDGRIWMGGGGRRVAAYTPGGSATDHQMPFRPNDGAVDGKGRLWLATGFGLGVFEGGKLDMRQMSNSALPHDRVVHVAVTGNGGVLPPKAAQTPGAVTGSLVWYRGGPVPNARLQLCGSPVPMRLARRDSTPCQGLPLTFEAKTDGDGKFSFAKVPPAVYRLAVQWPETGKWVIISLGRKGRLAAGKTLRLGNVRVTENLKRK